MSSVWRQSWIHWSSNVLLCDVFVLWEVCQQSTFNLPRGLETQARNRSFANYRLKVQELLDTNYFSMANGDRSHNAECAIIHFEWVVTVLCSKYYWQPPFGRQFQESSWMNIIICCSNLALVYLVHIPRWNSVSPFVIFSLIEWSQGKMAEGVSSDSQNTVPCVMPL